MKQVKSSEFKIVYKITWPNRKIYVGRDLADSITYFGNPHKKLIDAVSPARDACRSMTLNRTIPGHSRSASDTEVRQVERRFILKLCSSDPSIGYNRSPKAPEPISNQDPA